MLQERLKKDTRPDHETLEEAMFVHSIMNGSLSLEQYKQLLTTNYCIQDAFEAFLFSALSPQVANELQSARRRKLPALQMDWQELEMGVAPAGEISLTGPEAGWAGLFDKDPSVLGALYVLEGATLGGHVIVKKLATNPNLNHLNLGFHYYQVYGGDLVPNWKLFCEVLNHQPETAYPMMLAGARRMFAAITSVQYGHSLSPA